MGGWLFRIEDEFQHNKCLIICSGLDLVLCLSWKWEGIFIFIFISYFCVKFTSISSLCCEFPICLLCPCLGWWSKEPAGLKTLRLVSMPSWRHTSSEEQEEEDDDDVVGPPGDAGIPAGTAGTAGPSESLRFSRSPSSLATSCLLFPPGNLSPSESG